MFPFNRFVEYATVKEAEKALTEFDHYNIGGGEYLKVRIKNMNQTRGPAGEADVIQKIASGRMSANSIGHSHDDQSVQGRSAPWMSQSDEGSQHQRSKSIGAVAARKPWDDAFQTKVGTRSSPPLSRSSQSPQNVVGGKQQSRSPFTSLTSGLNTQSRPETEHYASRQSPSPVNRVDNPLSPCSPAGSSEQKVTKLCTHCGKASTKRCLACKAPYCSKECQQVDWPEHLKVCSANSSGVTNAPSDPGQPTGPDAKASEQIVVVDPAMIAASSDFDISLGHLESPVSSPVHERPPSRPSSDQISPGQQGLWAQCNEMHTLESAELVSIQDLPSMYQVKYIPSKQIKCAFFIAEVLCREKETISESLRVAAADNSLPLFYPDHLHEKVKVLVRLNGELSRADVQAVKGNCISAELMDLGQFAEVNINNVYLMPNEIRLIPPLVKKYAFYGVNVMNCKHPDEVQAFLESQMKDKVLTVKVMGKNNFGNLVQVYDAEGVCINEVLCASEFFATMDTFPRQLMGPQHRVSWSKNLPVHTPPLAEPFEIIPTVVYNPTHIWAQINHEHLENLAHLIHDINTQYAQDHSTGYVPARGELCAAVSSKDNCWYRADVMQVDLVSQMCSVRFIDYGDKESVSLSKIRQLDDVFWTLPRQSVHLQLANVESADESKLWTDSVIDALSLKITDKIVKVQVVAYNEPFHYYIKMFDPDDPAKLLNDSLVESGAAKHVPLPNGVNVPAPTSLPIAGFGRAATILQIARKSQPGASSITSTVATPPSLRKGHGQGVGYPHSLRSPHSVPSSSPIEPHGPRQPVRSVGPRPTSGEDRRGRDSLHESHSGTALWSPVTTASPQSAQDQAASTSASQHNLSGAPVGVHYTPSVQMPEDLDDANIARQKSFSSVPPLPSMPPIGQNFPAIVTHVESVELFYLQVAKQDTMNILTEMSTRAAEEPPLTNVSVGQHCMAIFEGLFYRAKVVEMISAKEVVVQFIDFGNSETMFTDKLHQLDSQSALVPAMAITCTLADASRLRKGANEFFTELVLNQNVMGVVQGVGTTNVAGVKLSFNDGREILSLLSQQGFVFTSGDHKPLIQQKGIPSAFPQFTINQLPQCFLSEGMEVMVTHIDSPSSLWLQLGAQSTLDALDNLEKVLLSPGTQPLSSLPPLDSLCLAKFSDGYWYRALVCKHLDDSHISVHFIDYGNSSTVALPDTRTFVKELLSTAPLAIECSLKGIEPTGGGKWSNDAVMLLQKHAQDAMATVSDVKQVGSNKYVAHLEDKQGKSFSDGLLAAKLAVKNGASQSSTLPHSPTSVKQPIQPAGLQQPPLLQQRPKPVQQPSSSNTVLLPSQGKPITSTSPVHHQISASSRTRSNLPSPPIHFTTPMKPKVTFKPLAPPHSRFNALVVSANSPSSMWFQVLDGSSQEALIALYRKIASFADSCPPASLRWNPGDCCAVLNTDDDTWYRAELLTAASPSSMTMRLVDFGLEHVTSVENMRLLTDDFVKLPAQAVPAKLAGIAPVDGSQKWSQPAIQCLQDLILEKKVAVEVVSHEDGMLVVDMCDSSPDKVSVSQRLMSSTLAKSTVPPKQPSVSPVHSTKSPASLVPTQVMKQSAKATTPMTSPQKQRIRAHDYYWVEVPPVGETFNAMVSHVVSAGKFWFQVASKENVGNLTKLLDQVNRHVSSPKAQPFTSTPASGEMCLAQFSEDQMWYRAVVLDVSPAATTVQFVDFGNVDTLSPSSIYHIPSQLLTLPFQAVCASLVGLPEQECSSPSVQLTTRFSQLVDGKCLSCEVISGEPLCISLMDLAEESGLTVRDTLVRMELLPFMEDSSIPKLEVAEINQSEQATVIIAYDRGPGDFYVQVVSQGTVQNFNQLMSQIGDYCSRCPRSMQDALLGQVVFAKFYEDQSWYRARVIGFVDDTSVHVQFVDFGNTDIVSVGTLIPIHSDFTHLPAQAVHCCLKGFEGKRDTTKEMVDKFQQLTGGKALVAEVCDVICDENGGKRCSVELTDTSSSADVKISCHM